MRGLSAPISLSHQPTFHWEPLRATTVPMAMVMRTAGTVALLAWSLSACEPVERGAADRFTSTGELIALSGGDAGAANACIACHGVDGTGNGDGAPRIAGLDRGYLIAQLQAYADGRRRHREMEAIARKLTPLHQDAVSAYYAALSFAPSPPLRPAGSAASTRAGALYHYGDPARNLAPCARCHGSRGEGLGPANPPLGGQPAPYLAEQLDQWRRGARRSDPENVMLRIARAITPAESAALAVYASLLPAGPPHPGSPAAFREEHRADPRNGASAPPLRASER